MERMEEVVPEADHQALQHMLSESAWEERAVLDQVAQDANRHLGDTRIAASSLMRAAVRRKGSSRWGWRDNGVASWARSRTAQWGSLPRLAVGQRPP